MRRNLLRKLAGPRAAVPRHRRLRRLGRSRSSSNAVLSKHNMILLGPARPGEEPDPARADQPARRGGCRWSPAARSTTTRSRPLCRRCRDLVAEQGDEHADRVAARREQRYVEKLATPGRDHRRHHRRRGPDPGRARRARPRRAS
ncbi:MAG: hypothetical protein MZV64_11715 [Ignavibacteriales bacterium]|nr:hypothetical protein [Ignavibacteriales bacterium]